ncbi:FadR/GntR family transcriptional regulator [Labrys monachus]|uniref:GntR family transcriptional repressor for pyruvate dehydrogenase complex n=1 Tax=Labrys monachus TaxID=217067 RepID=A0ABU0FMM3_9HYPH|nr:FadR/GntR family transcriptional regulator [Labrys monachus]MDQ0395860.1 GntR family transcriptional repressor for pyruvate dehydrogenase complex [Labrys monachus]
MAKTDEFPPIERNSIAEQVAKKLLEMIRTKNLRPGDMLPTERDLAAMMQVSRPSVREAVRGLQILGVLKIRQGYGIYVSSLDAAELLGPLQFLLTLNAENIDALYEIRFLIDPGVARLAAGRISDADIERLRQLVAAQQDLVFDPLSFRASDLRFHTLIMEATGNSFMVRTSSSLYLLGFEYRRIASETPGVLRQSLADHEAIVAALEQRDGEAAARAVERHLRNVHRSTVDAMEDDK